MRAWQRLRAARALVFSGRCNRHNGLQQRHQKAELEAAWTLLKKTYTDIWAEAGQEPSKTTSRLRALEEKHRQRVKAKMPYEGKENDDPATRAKNPYSSHHEAQLRSGFILSSSIKRRRPPAAPKSNQARANAAIGRLLRIWLRPAGGCSAASCGLDDAVSKKKRLSRDVQQQHGKRIPSALGEKTESLLINSRKKGKLRRW